IIDEPRYALAVPPAPSEYGCAPFDPAPAEARGRTAPGPSARLTRFPGMPILRSQAASFLGAAVLALCLPACAVVPNVPAGRAGSREPQPAPAPVFTARAASDPLPARMPPPAPLPAPAASAAAGGRENREEPSALGQSLRPWESGEGNWFRDGPPEVWDRLE